MRFKFVFCLFAAVIIAVSCKSVSCDIKLITPNITYINLWTDENGGTHLSECELGGFNLQFYITSAKQYVSTNDMPTKRYVFNIFPPKWIADWHRALSLQWVITLSGSWYIRASDGSVVNLPTGAITFNNDLNATIGHQSGVSENYNSAKVICIQVSALPKDISTLKCSAGGYWKRDLPPQNNFSDIKHISNDDKKTQANKC